MGRLLETDAEVFEQTWRLHTIRRIPWVRQVVPEMLSRGSGAILIHRVRPRASGPWPTSRGVLRPPSCRARSRAGAGARSPSAGDPCRLYINVDGGIDMPLLRELRPDVRTKTCSNRRRSPDAFWYLAHQDPSAWTHELDGEALHEKF